MDRTVKGSSPGVRSQTLGLRKKWVGKKQRGPGNLGGQLGGGQTRGGSKRIKTTHPRVKRKPTRKKVSKK